VEQPGEGPQTAGLVIQPFQTVTEDIFIWTVGTKCSKSPLELQFRNTLTYLLTYLPTNLFFSLQSIPEFL